MQANNLTPLKHLVHDHRLVSLLNLDGDFFCNSSISSQIGTFDSHPEASDSPLAEISLNRIDEVQLNVFDLLQSTGLCCLPTANRSLAPLLPI